VLPYLSIEMDGNPLPQVVEARLEAFSLQVEKLHEKMQGNGGLGPGRGWWRGAWRSRKDGAGQGIDS
jgi:hypothetical protein